MTAAQSAACNIARLGARDVAGLQRVVGVKEPAIPDGPKFREEESAVMDGILIYDQFSSRRCGGMHTAAQPAALEGDAQAVIPVNHFFASVSRSRLAKLRSPFALEGRKRARGEVRNHQGRRRLRR